MKKNFGLIVAVLLSIAITFFTTSYFAVKNLRKSFNENILEMEAFNGIHRINSFDRLEQLLIKGCHNEALKYVRMEQSLNLLHLQDNIKNGAKIDEKTRKDYASIIERAHSIVNQGKYYIPECK